MGLYDEWRSREPEYCNPGRPRFNRREKPQHLICRDCPFVGTFTEAVAHFRLTNHQLLGKGGHPQDLEKFRVTREELVDRR